MPRNRRLPESAKYIVGGTTREHVTVPVDQAESEVVSRTDPKFIAEVSRQECIFIRMFTHRQHELMDLAL